MKESKAGRRPKYTESFARQVVRDILINHLTFRRAAQRYNIASATHVHRWYKKYSVEIGQMITTPKPIAQENDVHATDKDAAAIKELQKALEIANLKITSLEIMIDIAEDELNVDIRKKSGTKQPEE